MERPPSCQPVVWWSYPHCLRNMLANARKLHLFRCSCIVPIASFRWFEPSPFVDELCNLGTVWICENAFTDIHHLKPHGEGCWHEIGRFKLVKLDSTSAKKNFRGSFGTSHEQQWTHGVHKASCILSVPTITTPCLQVQYHDIYIYKWKYNWILSGRCENITCTWLNSQNTCCKTLSSNVVGLVFALVLCSSHFTDATFTSSQMLKRRQETICKPTILTRTTKHLWGIASSSSTLHCN